MEFMRYLIAFGVFSLLVVLYVGSYVLNKRTKTPAGCEDLTASCTGCMVTSCPSHVDVEGGVN